MSEDTNPIDQTDEETSSVAASPSDVAKAARKPKRDIKASAKQDEEPPAAEIAAEDDVELDIPVAEEPAPKVAVAPPSAPHVVGDGDRDPVHLSRIIYKNITAKKSLSVHHLQRRLNELGYSDAYLDKDGWYGDLTKQAIAAFQKDHGLDGDGAINAQTLTAIFENDANVVVVV